MKGKSLGTLAASLEHLLGQPPVRTGLRLRSERDLAAVLQTDRNRIHRSLDELVAEGILVRRHGSGTFVRKVPAAPRKGRLAADLSVTPEMLFVRQEAPSTRRRVTASHCRLHLGLWSDLHCTTRTNRHILACIVERGEELGHRVTIHTVIERIDVPLGAEELAGKLREQPCDGYLVVTRWADQFIEALGSRRPPTVYFAAGSARTEHEPQIMIDTDQATERAVRRLAGQGYRRIALLGLDSLAHDPAGDMKVYERAMTEARLGYRAMAFADIEADQVAAAVGRLMDRSDPPEALYVADDGLMMAGAVEALASYGRVPGRNLAVITLAVRGNPLPPGWKWSGYEFNPALAGRMAIDSLLRVIQTAGEELCSFSHQAAWRPGDTHLLASVASDAATTTTEMIHTESHIGS